MKSILPIMNRQDAFLFEMRNYMHSGVTNYTKTTVNFHGRCWFLS